MLLDRIERLDLDDPVEERRRLVDSLASMPLADADVMSARDVCVRAHRSILEAEEKQAHAAMLLARYESDEVPSAGDQLRIRRDIDEADGAIQRSRSLFARCHSETQALQSRYRRRPR